MPDNPMISLLGNLAKGAAQGASDVTGAAAGTITQMTSAEKPEQRAGREKRQKGYEYEYAQYPLDLANDITRHPHYITFYIATQDLSKYKPKKSNGPPPLSTVDINARASRTMAKSIPGTNNIGFGRKTHRTIQAIRLFMPDTLAWNFSNQFGEASLSGIMGMSLVQAGASLPKLADSAVEGFKESGITGILASLDSKEGRAAGAPLAELLGEAVPGLGASLAASALGVAVNPQVDVIYQSPVLREFNFEFLFAPRSKQEAEAVGQIIYLFKFHSAPELLDKGIGRYFIPPSEFDIEFSARSLGKISTCVLTDVSLDYAPAGSAFYQGEDSHPVNIRMVLRFKELEFITKELINRGY